MANFINVGGTWKNISKIYQNVGASWKNVTKGYINVAGAWKVFFSSQYTFSFGDHLYVGSNGYIGLDAGGNTASTMGAGRNISIYNIDLQQWYLAEYSDTSTYSLYFRSYLYNTIGSPSSLNALDYQIKFYNDVTKPYCDVYIVRKGSNVGFAVKTPGYYTNGNSGNTGIQGPYALVTGSTMRIYFDGTVATTSGISWTAIDVNYWDLIRDDRPYGLDDSFTDVTTATNQSAPIPANTVLPTLTTNTGNFTAGSTITINTGTWTNANSYAYELLYSSSTPIADGASTKTLTNTNQYVITDGDANAPSYYFRGKVTGYYNADQTGNSAVALSVTSNRSTYNATTTISVGTATSTGFTISGTAGPVSGFGTTRVNVSSIQIYNSSQSLLNTITTSLPVVNGTTGAWSYVWTGGSSSTTYYAKVTVKATDSSETTFTTAFSASITTSAGVSTPTALSAAVVSGNMVLTFSGGSGDQYDIYYANDSGRPTDGQAYVDFANKTSPFTTGLTNRGVKRWFWVRKSTGVLRSNFFPAAGTEVTAYISLLTPPAPVITNSVTAETSLSWHWTKPTPNSTTQDDPSSWDYKLDQSTGDPTTGLTNITTQPDSGSPVVTSGLSASTTYYLHVRPKNADVTGAWVTKSATTSAAAPVYAAVVWGAMNSPAFDRLNGSSRLRWGWNNQLPSSGDYTATNITWEWQYSSANSTTTQSATPTGLISSGARPNRAAGGLTVGGATYNNRVSSLSGDYTSGGANDAGTNEPVTFSTSSRYLRYRAVVVGSNGTTYRSNYSAWV